MKLHKISANETELHTRAATILFSYDTPVAACIAGTGFVRTDKFYSRTTQKHISGWLAGRTAETVPQDAFDTLLT